MSPILLDAPVTLVYEESILTTRVLRQDAREWILDAPRDAMHHIVPVPLGRAYLRWFETGSPWHLPITVARVFEPVPLVLIVPHGSPRIDGGRREARYRRRLHGYLYYVDTDPGAPLTFISALTDNVSISGVRTQTVRPVEPGRLIHTAWSLSPTTTLTARMRVLTIRHTAPGDPDTVLLWDPPLTGSAQQLWSAYVTRAAP